MKRIGSILAWILLSAIPAIAQHAIKPQIVAHAAVVVPTTTSAACPTSAHCVNLSWTAPADASGSSTYNVYRMAGACPASAPTSTAGFTKLTAAPQAATTYSDSTVTPGSWCYVATQVAGALESAPSNNVLAAILPLSPGSMVVTSAN
ncbi:MAG TPA: hypothetical protein VLY23_18465 [Candidatus Acidoferrum sp.]|nr:hypothetical protein [Candidatus Acidoferrum sp.]